MKVINDQAKEDLTRRLRRIEGQVQGVQRMVVEGRDCREILQQLSAIRSAVQGASLAFVQEAATECLVGLDEKNPAARTALVNELIDLVGKAS